MNDNINIAPSPIYKAFQDIVHMLLEVIIINVDCPLLWTSNGVAGRTIPDGGSYYYVLFPGKAIQKSFDN